MNWDKNNYIAWALKYPSGKLKRDVFKTKKSLIEHYTWGGTAKSEEWKKMKKEGFRAVSVLVKQI